MDQDKVARIYSDLRKESMVSLLELSHKKTSWKNVREEEKSLLVIIC